MVCPLGFEYGLLYPILPLDSFYKFESKFL